MPKSERAWIVMKLPFISNSPFAFETDKYSLIVVVSSGIGAEEEKEEKWISLRVKFSMLSQEIASVVKEGDIEKDSSGRIIAKIQSIIIARPSSVLSVDGERSIILEHPFNKDLVLSLNLLCQERNGAYYFRNRPIKVGLDINFATDFYSISGTIIGMRMQ